MIIRPATRTDLPQILEIYNLDPITGRNENITDHLPDLYTEAFDRIVRDANQILLVAEVDSQIAGTLQITFIQHLIVNALRRAVLEAVFIHPSFQGKGIGSLLIEESVRRAKNAGCRSVELTSNKARSRAHGFYERAGFVATHEGYKRALE